MKLKKIATVIISSILIMISVALIAMNSKKITVTLHRGDIQVTIKIEK